MNNWAVGDILESRDSCAVSSPWYVYTGQNILNTVSTKTVSAHSTTYTLIGTSATPSCIFLFNQIISTAGPRTFYDSVFSILDTTRMPEDQYSNGAYSIYYFSYANDYCFAGPSYAKRPATYMPGLGGYYEKIAYKLGVGLTSSIYADGNPSYKENSLFYYNINGISCGTFLSAPSIENEIAQIQISPNPATHALTLKLTGSGLHTITLQNLLGQSVRIIQTNRQEETMKVSDLSNGMYIVTITDEQGNKSSHKVMIQH
jgi:hypothetical protein